MYSFQSVDRLPYYRLCSCLPLLSVLYLFLLYIACVFLYCINYSVLIFYYLTSILESRKCKALGDDAVVVQPTPQRGKSPMSFGDSQAIANQI